VSINIEGQLSLEKKRKIMKTILTIEATIHDLPMPWVLAQTNEASEVVSEESGTYRPGRENTDEFGDVYDLDDLKAMAAEVYECDSIASGRNMRRVK